MRAIYKYPLIGAVTPCAVSRNAKIVHVGLDHKNVANVWIELPNNKDPRNEVLKVHAVNTAQKIPAKTIYRGSFHQDFVMWHVYSQ